MGRKAVARPKRPIVRRAAMFLSSCLIGSALATAGVTVITSVAGRVPPAGASGGPTPPPPVPLTPPTVDLSPTPGVYSTERYGNFDYEIPEPPGSYLVHLVDAETVWDSREQRVWSVTADGVPVITNLDMIAQLADAQGADDQWFTTTVTGPTLSLVFSSAVDNATVRGIEVFPASGQQTPVVRIDSGSTTPYTDPAGNVWSADVDVTGGATYTPAQPSSGTPLFTPTGSWAGPHPTFTYAWQRCDSRTPPHCTTIAGATSATYAPTPVDSGVFFRSLVTATTGGGSATEASLPTANSAGALLGPRPSGLPSVGGTPMAGAPLTAATGAFAGLQPTFTYAWSQCNAAGSGCVPITGATSSTYTPVSGDVGHTIEVGVSATTTLGSATTISPPTQLVAASGAAEPTVQPSTVIVPGTQVYQAARSGSFTYTIPLANGNYQVRLLMAEQGWQSPGSRVFNVTSQGSIVLGGIDLYKEAGFYISDDKTFTATVSNGSLVIGFIPGVDNPTVNGIAVTSISNPNAPPVLIASGASTSYVDGLGRTWMADTDFTGGGTFATNGTTTQHFPVYGALPGTWTGSPTGYTYQWERCDPTGATCAAISGATGQTYATSAADTGATLRAQVTAVASGGSATVATAPTATVATNPLITPPASTEPPVVYGPATVGAAEGASIGGWSAISGGYTFAWQRCDTSGNNCTAISGASTTTYTPTATDVGHTLRFGSTAASAAQPAGATSTPTPVVAQPQAPSNVAVPVVTGGNQSGVKLTTGKGIWLNVPTSYTYAWKRCDTSGNNCTTISGATASTYTQGTSDVGHTIRSAVTATNGGGSSPATTSTQTATVASTSAPKNTAAPAVSGTAHVGSVLTTTNGTWSNSPTSYAYAWLRCDTGGANCSPISGATATTYTLASADAAHTIRSQVTATNASGSVFAWSNPTAVIVVSGAPAMSSAPSAPSPVTGNGVYTTNRYAGFSYAIPVPAPGVYQVRLLLDEAYGNSYATQLFDVTAQGQQVLSSVDVWGETGGYDLTDDKAFTVTLTGTTLNLGFPIEKSDDELAGIQVTSITNPTMPPIRIDVGSASSYTDAQGNVWAADEYYSGGGTGGGGGVVDRDGPLTVTTGTWTNNPTSYAYQWERCDTAVANCTPISGATTATYTPGAADNRSVLIVAVTATNSSGSATGLSAATTAITLISPIAMTPPLVSGATTSGYTLNATSGGWSSPAATFAFQWQRCDTNGANCAAISGATATSYTLAAGDVGHTINVAVTDTTTAGAASATSSPTTTILAATGAPVALSGDSAMSEPGTGDPASGSGLYFTTRYGNFNVTTNLPNGTYAVRVPMVEQFDNGAGQRRVVILANGTEVLRDVDIWAEGGWYTSDDQYFTVPVTAGALTLSFGADADAGSAAGLEITSLTNPTMTPVRIDLGSSTAYTDPLGNVWAADTSYVSGGGTATVNSAVTDRAWTLSATSVAWANSPTGFAYQWERCDPTGANCAAVPAATTPLYTVGAADVGTTLRQQVTATNTSGNATVTSAPSLLVKSYPSTPNGPPNILPPTITAASLVANQNANTTSGTWAITPARLSYAWQQCNAQGANCQTIAGENDTSYTTQTTDIGFTIRSVVTLADSTGYTSAVSAAVPVTTTPSPTNTVLPAVQGLAQQSTLLTVDPGAWSQYNGTQTPVWEQCDNQGNNCTTLTTAASYRPVSGDIGHTLRVQVTATNSGGNTTATSPPSNIVLAPGVAPSAPQNVTATPVTGGLLVTWTPPTSNGNDPIVSNTVTATVNGVLQGSITVPSDSTSARFDSLPAGPATVTVTASNSYWGAGASSSPSAQVTIPTLAAGGQGPDALKVFVAYADMYRGHNVPSPWAGSPNTDFVGFPEGNIDAGALRFHNPTATAVTITNLSVTIGANNYNIWGNNTLTVPANGDLVATQTAHLNFDTSDPWLNGPDCTPPGPIPQITFTANGTVTTVEDTGQILDTGGVDGTDCTGAGVTSTTEFNDWTPIGTCGNADTNLGVTNANQPACDDHQGDPVDTHTGNYTETATDLSVAGIGPSLTAARTYNSAKSQDDGMFGYGWSSNLGMQIDLLTAGGLTPDARVHDESGNVIDFGPAINYVDPARLIGQYFNQGEVDPVYFNGRPDLYATLSEQVTINEPTADNADIYTFVRKHNQIFQFAPPLPNQVWKCNTGVPLLDIQDLVGNEVLIGRDADGRVSTVIDPTTSRQLTFGYTGTGVNYCHVTSVTDSTNRSVHYTYDALGNLSTVQDAMGGTTQYSYTDQAQGHQHLVTAITKPSQYQQPPPIGSTLIAYCTGQANCPDQAVQTLSTPAWDTNRNVVSRTTTFSYASGGVTTITDPSNNITVDTYTNGHLANQVAGSGSGSAVTTQYTYAHNQIAQVKRTAPNDTITHTVSYGTPYDVNGNPPSVTDGLGNVTKYLYDTTTNTLTSLTDGNGITATYTRDPFGNLVSSSTPISGNTNQVTQYAYNGIFADRPTTITDPDNKQWQLAYDPSTGALTSITSPLGNITRYCYDNLSRLTGTITPVGVVNGTTCTTATPAPYETTYSYDAADRLRVTTDALGNQNQRFFDADGNLSGVEDGSLNTTTYVYDPGGELIQTIRPDHSTLNYTYYANGTVSQSTDGAGNPTSYIYDALNRPTTVSDPLGHQTTYTYDAVGHILSRTDADHGSTAATWTYNAADELQTVTYQDTSTVNFTAYDADHQATQMTDGAGTTNWTWDAAHRLTSSADLAGTVRYGYNLRNDLTSITYPNTKTVSYGVDDDGRTNSVTDWLTPANTTTYTFPANAAEVIASLANGTTALTTQDTAGQLQTVANAYGGSTFAGWTYTHYQNGLLQSETPTGVGTAESYIYTALNQLKTINSTNLTYDAADNLTATDHSTNQAFNAADSLCWSATASGTDCASPPGGATTYNVDLRGNRTRASTTPATVYTWNQAGQLTGITGPTTATYQYNGQGLRVQKTVNGTTTTFAWDTAATVPLLLTDGSNNWIYGPDGLPLEQINGNTTTYYHHDAQGSTRATTPQAGAPATTATYDDYGRLTSGSQTTSLGYAGQYTDIESGLIYLRARYYDPGTGQFLSKDPRGTADPFAYAGNSPINAGDPSGLCWYCVFDPWSAANPIRTGSYNDPRGLGAWLNEHANPGYAVAQGFGTRNYLEAAQGLADTALVAITAGQLAGVALDLLGGGATAGVSEVGANEAGTVAFRSDTSHIFRDDAGHLLEDTPANRAVIQGAIDPANLRSTITLPDGSTLAKYFQTLPDGTQAWAAVRNGIEITNGGVNVTPR